MPISLKKLEQAVRQARALRSDRVEIHVAAVTLRESGRAFDVIRAQAARAGQEVSVAADSMVPEWCVQVRNLEDRRSGKVAPIVDVRGEAEAMYAEG